MSQIIQDEDNKSEQETFNVQLVKLAEPILIKDESKTNEENKNVTSASDNHNTGYPDGYNQMLDMIFPPREWEENGKTWRQTVSMKPASQNDLCKLEEDFASLLRDWNVESEGLMPIRKELFGQLFNELIRQVCAENEEMCNLLIRIQKEFKSTLEAYAYNFENSIAFNLRKSKTAYREYNEMQINLEAIKETNLSLKKKVADAKVTFENHKNQWADEFDVLIEKNKQHLDFVTKNHESLQKQLNAVLKLKK